MAAVRSPTKSVTQRGFEVPLDDGAEIAHRGR